MCIGVYDSRVRHGFSEADSPRSPAWPALRGGAQTEDRQWQWRCIGVMYRLDTG